MNLVYKKLWKFKINADKKWFQQKKLALIKFNKTVYDKKMYFEVNSRYDAKNKKI